MAKKKQKGKERYRTPDEGDFIDEFRAFLYDKVTKFVERADDESAGGSWYADCDHYGVGKETQLAQFVDWLLEEQRSIPGTDDDEGEELTLSDLAVRMDDLELKIDKLLRPRGQRR